MRSKPVRSEQLFRNLTVLFCVSHIDMIAPMKKSSVLVLVLLFLLTAVSTTNAIQPSQEAVGQFTPSECFFDTGVDFFLTPERLGFECGYVTVPETHANPNGPTIRIPVAVRLASSSTAAPDPLFLAQGGPGGDAFMFFSLLAPNTPIASNRDLVIFNQRGTLYAEPDLICEEVWDSRIPIFRTDDEDEAEQLGEDAFNQCFERLVNEEGIDLSAYDSLENAADINMIRQALGYDSYNFYGVSYGTLLGLHLINTQPDGLRSVVLDSVVPTQLNFVEQVPLTENRAYDEYLAFCSENPTCQSLYPNLEQRVTALYEELNEDPKTVRLTDGETGDSVRTEINGDTLRSIIFQLFYLRDFYAVFPRLVEDLEEGNFLFIEAIYPLFAFDRTLSEGMYYSVVCAEDNDFSPEEIDLSGVRPFIAENIREELQDIKEGCNIWNVEPLPDSIDDPVQSDIPVLLLSGRFDPITPPSYAALAAETLPNSYNYVDPIGSHGVAFGGSTCLTRIVADFLNNPTSEPSAACLENETFTEIVPPDAVQVPILNKLGNLETAATVQFGLFILFALGLLSGFVLWPIAFVIRKLQDNPQQYKMHPRARFWGRMLVLLAGVLGVIFVAGFIYFAVQIFSNIAFLTYGVFPAAARALFVLSPIILIVALTAVYLLIRAWRDSSIWGKIYTVFLSICLIGISVLLFTLRLFEPIFL